MTRYEKLRKFVDETDASLTFRRSRGPRGEREEEVTIDATDDLIGVAKAVEEAGLLLVYDGAGVKVIAPEGEPLPEETTPEPEEET